MCNQIETLTTTLRIQLTTPAQDQRPVYLTGNFCNWAAGLEEFRMTPAGDGYYTFEFPAGFQALDPLEYKFTRGSWEQVEVDSHGQPHGLRVTTQKEGIIQDVAMRWRKDPSQKPDFKPLIEVLSCKPSRH